MKIENDPEKMFWLVDLEPINQRVEASLNDAGWSAVSCRLHKCMRLDAHVRLDYEISSFNISIRLSQLIPYNVDIEDYVLIYIKDKLMNAVLTGVTG